MSGASRIRSGVCGMCRIDLLTEPCCLLWLYNTFKLEFCDPTAKTTEKLEKTLKMIFSLHELYVISLYKEKGQKANCSSYRPSSLVSVPSKVFTHILLGRLHPLLVRQRHPYQWYQSGFTQDRSTADAILTLRLLAELHREFDKSLHTEFIDIKSVFDSVDRDALWKALAAKLTWLIQDLQILNRSGEDRQ